MDHTYLQVAKMIDHSLRNSWRAVGFPHAGQDRHKIALCEICAEVGADSVKTSTGYGSGGATMADLQLMRRHSPPHVRVKSAGGIRTLDGLLQVRAIGVSRKRRLEACTTETAAPNR